ncbi:MAG: leucine-rich repeat protein [Bacteroidales bacterium]|nr:leucine-rich repeat protein [Bacteroidales bacterium]
MKHKLTFFAVLIMVLALPQLASAYDFSYTYQGATLYYSVRGTVVSVVNPTGGNYYSYVSGDVVIPSSVTHGGINYTVKSISDDAFRNCISMTSVTISDSIISIGWRSFHGCSGLSSVVLSNSVSVIPGSTFYGCSNLTSISIPNSVTDIFSSAFYGCSSLVSLELPNSITNIESSAFANCSSLVSLYIPSSLTTLGSGVFSGCSNLESIVVAADNSHFDSRDSCNAIIQTDLNILVLGCKNTVIPDEITVIGNYAFNACTGLTEVVIPDEVVSIGYYAFENCSGLTSVTIGSGVTTIGGYAFLRCDNLNSIFINALNPPTITNESYTFGYGGYNLRIYVPCGTVDAYRNAWYSWAYYIYGTPELDFAYSFVSNNDTMGSVEVSEIDCDSNVTVSATAHSGYMFYGWSDGGTDNSRTFHLSGDTSVTANFGLIRYQLTVLPNDSTMGSVTGSGIYTHGSQVTVTATPASGNRFDRWSNNTLFANYTFTLTSNMQLVAVFCPVDTVVVHDTIYDTIYITDTIYVGVDEMTVTNVKMYVLGSEIVVENAEGYSVSLYDAVGQMLATKQYGLAPVRFAVPISGTYIVKVGNYPARKVVVVR